MERRGLCLIDRREFSGIVILSVSEESIDYALIIDSSLRSE